MTNLPKLLFIFVFILLLSANIEAKAKIYEIKESNFDKFTKDASYWILQISNTPCPNCQQHEKQLSNAAEILDGVCKIGKVDAKYLKGMNIPSNPTYLFLRSDNIQENTEFK